MKRTRYECDAESVPDKNLLYRVSIESQLSLCVYSKRVLWDAPSHSLLLSLSSVCVACCAVIRVM